MSSISFLSIPDDPKEFLEIIENSRVGYNSTERHFQLLDAGNLKGYSVNQALSDIDLHIASLEQQVNPFQEGVQQKEKTLLQRAISNLSKELSKQQSQRSFTNVSITAPLTALVRVGKATARSARDLLALAGAQNTRESEGVLLECLEEFSKRVEALPVAKLAVDRKESIQQPFYDDL